jgi:hypothetical protein
MEDKPFPLSKGVIWVMCLAMPVICGSVLYYVWKGDNLKAANYANRVSWLSGLLWVLGYVLYRTQVKGGI